MIFDSLSSFLRHLEKINLLKKIPVEVDPELEITEIINRLYFYSAQNSSLPPALLFEKVKGSKFPLVINLLGTEKNIEILLDGKPENIGKKISGAFSDLQTALSKKRLFSWFWDHRDLLKKIKSANTIEVSTAQFKEIKKTGNQINLHEFPIMKCWPLDGGKFITAGLVLTKSPKTGARNLGIYRLQVLSQNQLILHWQIQKGGGFHYAKSEELNQPLEVAIVIGSDPLLWLAGILPLPEGIDEIAFAGFVRGNPIPMTHCETIKLDVPSSSEIVIEGIVYPKKRAMEGPFGDHFGHYSYPAPFPILDIQCITHKRNAIYHSAVVGKPPQEDKAMGETVSKMFLPIIKMTKPELVDLWAYYEAGFHNLLVASVRQRYEKEGVKTAFALLGEGQLSLSKCIILTDPEVDVRNFYSVLKAIRENFNPKNDFILLPSTSQDTLDFTGPKINYGSKIILDATKKSSAPSLMKINEGAVPSRELLREGTELRVESLEKLNSKKAPFSDIKHLDQRILNWKILEDTLLVVQVKSDGKKVLEKLLQNSELQDLKIIAIISEDVPLDDDVLLIWGIFTRFDCAKDILFSETKIEGSQPIYNGPMGIDATWKENYPQKIEMTEETKQRVTRRWKEYNI